MSNRKLDRMTRRRARTGAATIVIGSTPCAGVFQGFSSWKVRSHAVTGAGGSCKRSRQELGVPT